MPFKMYWLILAIRWWISIMLNLKPKIVKFKNGKYGLRKYSFLHGWVFAINMTGKWANKNQDLVQEYASRDIAEQAITRISDRQLHEKDIGS